jgi:hypothetical protein
MIIHTPL